MNSIFFLNWYPALANSEKFCEIIGDELIFFNFRNCNWYLGIETTPVFHWNKKSSTCLFYYKWRKLILNHDSCIHKLIQKESVGILSKLLFVWQECPLSLIEWWTYWKHAIFEPWNGFTKRSLSNSYFATIYRKVHVKARVTQPLTILVLLLFISKACFQRLLTLKQWKITYRWMQPLTLCGQFEGYWQAQKPICIEFCLAFCLKCGWSRGVLSQYEPTMQM